MGFGIAVLDWFWSLSNQFLLAEIRCVLRCLGLFVLALCMHVRGINVSDVSLDLAVLMKQKEKAVDQLTKGIRCSSRLRTMFVDCHL
jgi:hypothetical protein